MPRYCLPETKACFSNRVICAAAARGVGGVICAGWPFCFAELIKFLVVLLITGWYVRLLRDEVLAEWCAPVGSSNGGDDGPALHVYCHVSGQERWLAPPQLRNYIFKREMPLVSGFLHGGYSTGFTHQGKQSRDSTASANVRCRW